MCNYTVTIIIDAHVQTHAYVHAQAQNLLIYHKFQVKKLFMLNIYAEQLYTYHCAFNIHCFGNP